MSKAKGERVGGMPPPPPPTRNIFAALQCFDLPALGEVKEFTMIGNLNQRAALQSETLTPDGGGGFSESWTTFATVWIALAPLTGSDVFGPDRNESQVRYRITLRRRDDVSAGQRVIVGTRSFAITAVLDSGPQSQLMTLDAEAVP